MIVSVIDFIDLEVDSFDFLVEELQCVEYGLVHVEVLVAGQPNNTQYLFKNYKFYVLFRIINTL